MQRQVNTGVREMKNVSGDRQLSLWVQSRRKLCQRSVFCDLTAGGLFYRFRSQWRAVCHHWCLQLRRMQEE